MNVMWIFVIVAIAGLEYSTILGAPLTKWLKTDNNTYYIEEDKKVCIRNIWKPIEHVVNCLIFSIYNSSPSSSPMSSV